MELGSRNLRSPQRSNDCDAFGVLISSKVELSMGVMREV